MIINNYKNKVDEKNKYLFKITLLINLYINNKVNIVELNEKNKKRIYCNEIHLIMASIY